MGLKRSCQAERLLAAVGWEVEYLTQPTDLRSVGRLITADGKQLGGAERDRTVDLLNAIQALSQLSYSPTRVQPYTILAVTASTAFASAPADAPFVTTV